MNTKQSATGILPVVGMIVVLALARGFDALMSYLTRRNAQTFSLTSVIFVAYLFIILILAALLLFLFWLVLRQSPRKVWVSIVFLVTGLFFAASPALYFLPVFCCLSHGLETLFFPQTAFTSYMVLSSGFLAMMGLFGLILPKAN